MRTESDGMDDELQTTTGKYIGRWRHCTKLVFRVWPKWKLAHKAILTEKDIPITGIRIDKNGHPELWHQKVGPRAYVFEMDDADFDMITAIPKAGAKTMRDIVVHAPGTANERTRKECWAEASVLVYPKASERKTTPWGSSWNPRAPHEIWGDTPEDALGLAGLGGGRIVFIENDEDIDEEEILREVLQNDAMIVLNHRPAPGLKSGVSTRAGRRLVEKAMYWTVPDRQPWEDGGALRGYQFPDRIVRWNRRVAPEKREDVAAARLGSMHETTREKGRASRRTYFIENVVTRFAERVGMSRQRVMARFLDDGVVDWLVRSVDNIKPILHRETSALLRGRVTDAVNALEFYYRAVEGLSRGNGEQGTGNGGGR